MEWVKGTQRRAIAAAASMTFLAAATGQAHAQQTPDNQNDARDSAATLPAVDTPLKLLSVKDSGVGVTVHSFFLAFENANTRSFPATSTWSMTGGVLPSGGMVETACDVISSLKRGEQLVQVWPFRKYAVLPSGVNCSGPATPETGIWPEDVKAIEAGSTSKRAVPMPETYKRFPGDNAIDDPAAGRFICPRI